MAMESKVKKTRLSDDDKYKHLIATIKSYKKPYTGGNLKIQEIRKAVKMAHEESEKCRKIEVIP